jgi:hypothetical protein
MVFYCITVLSVISPDHLDYFNPGDEHGVHEDLPQHGFCRPRPWANCLEQSQSIKLMDQLSNTINWSRIESILLCHNTVGTSEEGARAYPHLMLFKFLLLQKWFRIQIRSRAGKPDQRPALLQSLPGPCLQPARTGPLHFLPLPRPIAQRCHGRDQLQDPASVRAARAFHQRGRCRRCAEPKLTFQD